MATAASVMSTSSGGGAGGGSGGGNGNVAAPSSSSSIYSQPLKPPSSNNLIQQSQSQYRQRRRSSGSATSTHRYRDQDQRGGSHFRPRRRRSSQQQRRNSGQLRNTSGHSSSSSTTTGMSPRRPQVQRRTSLSSVSLAEKRQSLNKTNRVVLGPGLVLEGDELEEYCKKRGLCPLCARTKTRRRVFKVFKKNIWEPLTVQDLNGDFIVFKGYCVRPGCFSIEQAQRLAGDTKHSTTGTSTKPMEGNANAAYRSGEFSVDSASTKKSQREKTQAGSSPNLEGVKTQPRGGGGGGGKIRIPGLSRMSSLSSLTSLSRFGRRGNDGSSSHSEDNTDATTTTSAHHLSRNQTLTDPAQTTNERLKLLDGYDTDSNRTLNQERSHRFIQNSLNNNHNINDDKKNNSSSRNSTNSATGKAPRTALIQRSTRGLNPNSNHSAGKNYYNYCQQGIAAFPPPELKQTTNFQILPDKPLFVIEKSADALRDEHLSLQILDLSGIVLSRDIDLATLAKAFRTNSTLKSLVLESCKLDNDKLSILADGLNGATGMPLTKLYLRTNQLDGEEGIDVLAPFLEENYTLEKLDISRNTINNVGGVTIFNAFHRNRLSQIRCINLSHNELFSLNSGDANKFGVQSFLSRNRTLRILNLEGNYIHDDGAESIARGLLQNDQTVLERLYLGWNAIGDDGTIALAEMLESNTSLKVLGLGENNVKNAGARALLSAMASNTTLRDISGLWKNHINRRYIIFAIRRLLLSSDERQSSNRNLDTRTSINIHDITNTKNNIANDNNDIVEEEGSMSFSILKTPSSTAVMTTTTTTTAAAASTTNKVTTPQKQRSIHHGADGAQKHQQHRRIQEGSDVSATETVDTRISLTSSQGHARTSTTTSHLSSLTSDLDTASTHSTFLNHGSGAGGDSVVSDLSSPPNEKDRKRVSRVGSSMFAAAVEYGSSGGGGGGGYVTSRSQVASQGLSTLKEVATDDGLPFDRLMVFQSAPLAYFDRQAGVHKAIPLLDYKEEVSILRKSLSGAIGAKIEVVAELATIDKFTSFFTDHKSAIMHFSCFGHPDYLALENGQGSLQTLPIAGLARLIRAVGSNLQVVIISSCHGTMLAKAFMEAGVPHVICCQRETSFRDPVVAEFLAAFYKALANNKLLKAAYDVALKAVKSFPKARNLRRVTERFHLFPEHPESQHYHEVPVFFTHAVPTKPLQPDNMNALTLSRYLPPVPKYFLGREVDMFEILEALRDDDVIRIAGPPRSGKDAVVAAVCHYAMERKSMFSIDDIFWLPAPEGVEPTEDTLYGDLCFCLNVLRTANTDIWEEDEALLECRDRIEIELENQQIVLVMDDRNFSHRGAQEGLEQFIGHLLNTSNVKVILITSRNSTDGASSISASTQGSRIEETSIEIGPLDFKSTALLFGGISKFISSSGCPAAHSAAEFADLLEPTFISNMSDPSEVISQRRSDLFVRMGSGFPSSVVNAAKSMPKKEFIELIGIANRPEVYVDSLGVLENEIRRRKFEKDRAVEDKNFMRAMDLDIILEELEGMRPEFPTLQDLRDEEKMMKEELAAAVKIRQYDTANDLKRELLVVKKKIIKETREMNTGSKGPNERLNELKAKVQTMIDGDEVPNFDDKTTSATFAVHCEGRDCSFAIYPGDVLDFEHPCEAKGIVCWSNESCQLEGSEVGERLIEQGGMELRGDVSTLPVVLRTPYGAVRCGTGNAVIIGPSKYGKLEAPCVILAVGPISPQNGMNDTATTSSADDGSGNIQYNMIMLRSCYRSSLVLAKHAELQCLAISLLTTRSIGEKIYHETLKIGLMTLIEEVRFSHLRDVHILTSSHEEASILIRIMSEMGHRML